MSEKNEKCRTHSIFRDVEEFFVKSRSIPGKFVNRSRIPSFIEVQRTKIILSGCSEIVLFRDELACRAKWKSEIAQNQLTPAITRLFHTVIILFRKHVIHLRRETFQSISPFALLLQASSWNRASMLGGELLRLSTEVVLFTVKVRLIVLKVDGNKQLCRHRDD